MITPHDTGSDAPSRQIVELERRAAALEWKASMIERAINALPDLIVVKDPHLRVLHANQAFCAFHGKRLDEIVGAPESSFRSAGEAEAAAAQDRQVLSTGIYVDVPYAVQTRHDGVALTFHVQRCPLRDAEGNVEGVVVSARGVREEGGAASAVAVRAERHNRAMLSVIPDMYFRLSRDGTYVEFSAGRGMDTALPPSLFLGKRVQDVTPDIAPWVMECVEEALRTGEVLSREYQMFVQGRFVDYEARVMASGPDDVLFIVRDISRQKQTEMQLRDADARFRAFAGQSLFGVFVAREGRLFYANQKLADIVGCAGAEIEAEGLMPWIAEADRAALKRFFDDLDRPGDGGSGGLQRTFTGRRRDGTTVYLDTCCAAVSMDGKPAAIGVVLDVTESRLAAEAQRRLHDEVLRMQEALVAELSTPLIPISDTVVVMPLIGSIDERRAQQLMTKLLDGVSSHRAQVIILDVTGVSSITTQTAGALMRCAQAARLLGANVLLTGMRPDVAQTLVTMGVDMTGLVTLGTLKAGIAHALGRRAAAAPAARRP
ncbi:uncharacterized protein SOCEGT47_039570 [Sorangium cellulosum]|uniref:Anti-anti-sigma factor n=1 Tax=Sorangium cellulosum TaxID=56 RepID=A0A4V0NDP9_SORCE|nr:PAS domain-containing protein [Sorangium cellulosum]AUX23432.1 uncharacterized protein SOCEGT47_039570 [Sorangium cellulosum]